MSEHRRSIEQLCREARTQLLRYCNRIVGDTALAEDIVQETLLRAWQRRTELLGDRDPRPWLFTVARNLCFEALRTRGRTIAMAEVPERHHAGHDPVDHVEAAAERCIVREALAALSPRQREMILLKDVERVEYATLAQHLGVTEPAARVLLFRARRRLRERFAAASGAIAMAWTAVTRVMLRRARKAGDWVQTASLSSSLLLNAMIGLALSSSLSVPAVQAAGAARAPGATSAAATLASHRADVAATIHGRVAIQTATATGVRVDPSNGASLDAALPPSEAGEGRAWARTWRDRASGDSLIFGALDRQCARGCPFLEIR